MNRVKRIPDHDMRCILQYIYSNWYLFFLMILSPGSWQTWVPVSWTMHWFNYSEFLLSCRWWNTYSELPKYIFYLADDEAPILNCLNISSTTDEGLNSSSTVLLNPTVTDNVEFHVDVICSHTSDDIFLIGDTTVNCSSTDAAGNTNTCLLVVTVTGVNMIIRYV